MNTRIASIILMVLFIVISAESKPGETYTLTGEEKGVSEIIRADMAQYPDLYQGETLSGYISKFKRENRIGKRKLSPGDQLVFPDTPASLKAKRSKDKENANQAENSLIKIRETTQQYIEYCTSSDRSDGYIEKTFRLLYHDPDSIPFINPNPSNLVVKTTMTFKRVKIEEIDGNTVLLNLKYNGSSSYTLGYLLLTENGKIKYDSIFYKHPFVEALETLNSLSFIYERGHARELTSEAQYISRLELFEIPLFGLSVEKSKNDNVKSIGKIAEWLMKSEGDWDYSEPKCPLPEEIFDKLYKQYR